MTENLAYYLQAFTKLNVNPTGCRARPHKPVMLLAILELAETGLLSANRMYYNHQLREIFRSFFQAVQKPGDACNPHFPFFYMRSDRYAYIDEDLYSLIQKSEERNILGRGIVDAWFPADNEVLSTVAAHEKLIVS